MNAAFSIFSAASASRAPVERGARGCAPRRARRVEGCAVQVQAARIGAPLLQQLRPGELFGFGGAGGFLRGRQLRRRSTAVDDVSRLWAAHSRSWVERRDHAVMVSRSTPASSAIPVDGSTGAHSNPIDWCSSRRRVA